MTVIVVKAPARLVPLDTAFNLRDLGGYPTIEGRRVVWWRVYRSDDLGHLAGRDLDTVRSLGVRTVLDLRSDGEVAAGTFPVAAHPVALHHLPVLTRTWHEEEVDVLAALADRATPYLVARYLDLLDEGGPALAAAIEVMARPVSQPVLFHCAAGKDRTGVLAALVLSVLGVADEDIAADYTLSADAMARRLAWLQANDPAGAVAMAGQPAGWLAAPTEVMVTVLRHLREVHGGAESYLAAHGVDRSTFNTLRYLLLV